MDIDKIKKKPQRAMDLILKDQCKFPNLAVTVFHLADGYEAVGQAKVAQNYWKFLEVLLEGKATEDAARDFAEARSVGDPASYKQFMFLFDVDVLSRKRYLELKLGQKKSFLEATFETGRSGYFNPGQWSKECPFKEQRQNGNRHRRNRPCCAILSRSMNAS